MVGDLEAIGDAATGGVLGRAVEPAAGEGDGHTHERNCLNCGCALAGDYCHWCGQRAHVHRTLGAFWHDLLHGVLHFEGKIWRTLPLLVFKPGVLTRRYIDGQRASFVSPIALFLFSVFLMFAVINTLGSPDFSGTPEQMTSAEKREAIEEQLTELEAERARAAAEGRNTAAQDVVISELRRARTAPDSVQIKPRSIDLDSVSAPNWLEAAYLKAKKNPDLLFYKLQSNAYKFSWALIPISVPFIWLLFLHRRRYRAFRAYDHTVYVTYSLSFMTLLVVVFTLVGQLLGSNDLAVFPITLIPPFHIYRQLRGAYGLSRFSAIWRTAAIAVFAILCLTLFLLMLIAIGVM